MVQPSKQGRGPLPSCLRYLQACLLLLFFQDVFCFSLGYPFLPQHLGALGYDSRQVALTFTSYGLASIITLLLLLVVQCTPAAATAAPATQYIIVLGGAALAVGAGALSTALPTSYTALVVTRVLQGAASALYFVYTLTLVAAVHPLAYHSQAMAFTSAGLTLGDATGPILGGLVYDKVGAQGALALQPISAGVALVALLGLLVGWRKPSRPWNLAPPAAATPLGEQHHQQQHQQQQQQPAKPDCEAPLGAGQQGRPQQQQPPPPGPLPAAHKHHFELSHGAAAVPVLPCHLAPDVHHLVDDQGPCLGAPMACKHIGHKEAAHGSELGPPSEGQCRLFIPVCDTQPPAHSRSSTGAASSRQPPRLHGPRLLLSLLRHRGVVWCCWLALLCQAARTAVDLLVPLVLGAAVPPTLVGVLFVGEAVGSLLGPFLADARLAAVAKGSSSQSGGQTTGCLKVRRADSKDPAAAGDHSGAESRGNQGVCSASTCAAGASASNGVGEEARPADASSSDHSRMFAVAKRWLAGSGVVMAIGCFLVLSAWQWPPPGADGERHPGSWQALLLIASCLLVMGAGHSACETLIYTLLTHLVAAWPLTAHQAGCRIRVCCCSERSCMPQQQQLAKHTCCGKQCNSSTAGQAVGAEADSAAQAQVAQLVMVLYVLFWVAGFSIGAAAAGLPQGLLQQQAACWAMGLALLLSSVPLVCVVQQQHVQQLQPTPDVGVMQR